MTARPSAWQILFTCRKFWNEDLAVFYELATAVLNHELVLGPCLEDENRYART
jgi:hypothetical protein